MELTLVYTIVGFGLAGWSGIPILVSNNNIPGATA